MEKTQQKASKSGARVARCTCKHPAQDRIHGTGMRAMNACNAGYRCTVCGTTHKE